MTDLIASLADKIVALINASPHSPTKEEIGRAIMAVEGCSVVKGTVSSCPRCGERSFAMYSANEPPEGRHDFDWAGLCINCGALRNLVERQRPAAQAGGEEVSVEILAIAANLITAVDDNAKCLGEWDKAERATHKLVGYDGPTTKERMALAQKECDHDERYRIEAEKTKQALRDSMNTAMYGGPTIEDREKFWANKLNEPFDKGCNCTTVECHCGATKP